MYKIYPGRASRGNESPLALLSPDGDDRGPCFDRDQLRASPDADPGAIIVYNRLADALAPPGNPRIPGGRSYTEIRQDIDGVQGLLATRGRALRLWTPEPIYP